MSKGIRQHDDSTKKGKREEARNSIYEKTDMDISSVFFLFFFFLVSVSLGKEVVVFQTIARWSTSVVNVVRFSIKGASSVIVSVRDRVAPRLCSFGTASIGPSIMAAGGLGRAPAIGEGGRDLAARSHCTGRNTERGTSVDEGKW